jgi:hypothetical protein
VELPPMSVLDRLPLKPRLALTGFLPALAAVAATCALAVAGYHQETRVQLQADAAAPGASICCASIRRCSPHGCSIRTASCWPSIAASSCATRHP